MKTKQLLPIINKLISSLIINEATFNPYTVTKQLSDVISSYNDI